jgi:hypothetical protein
MSRDRGFLGQPAQHALGESRRCTATSKTTGQPCGAYAIPGGFVCGYHGGKAPQTVAAAKRRLMGLVELATDVLARAMECGVPDPVAVRAAQLVLDRSGLHPTLAVRAESAPDQAWTAYVSPDEMAVVTEIIERAKRRMEAGEDPPVLVAPLIDEIVEAVLPDRETPTGLATLATGPAPEGE